MKNNFNIRKATIKDLKDILRLNFELFKKESKEYGDTLNMKWTYTAGKKYFREKIIKKNSFAEVVESKGGIVGYLCGGISDPAFYRKKAKYAELGDMLIENAFRGDGIGTMLANDFITWCKKNKVDCISVTATAQNKPGLDFYRKLGFVDASVSLEMTIE
jgi:GNAT superfamily N-acetyltransferase